jgi:hypothetical protein
MSEMGASASMSFSPIGESGVVVAGGESGDRSLPAPRAPPAAARCGLLNRLSGFPVVEEIWHEFRSCLLT